MELASFFAGIGGFDLGFERAGIKTIWQCEINEFCRNILKQHWPEVTCAKDIKKVANEIESSESIANAAVWTGGFPCQDVSLAQARPRKGLRGKQSGLFFDFARLVDAHRPPTVVIENVAGLLSSHRGRDFYIVIRTLADIGYGVAWRVLNSRYFGVAQSRQRVFIVACYRNRDRAGSILFEPECREGNNETRRQAGTHTISAFKKVVGDSRKGPLAQSLAYCLCACSARHTGTDWSRTYISYPDGRVRRMTPVECERIQGFPDGWTIPTMKIDDIDRIDTLRYTAIGNAVTVNVAEWLGKRILANTVVTTPKKAGTKSSRAMAVA